MNMQSDSVTNCYVFRISGDLIHYFPCTDRTPDLSIAIPTMLPVPAQCLSRQQDFYLTLSEEDAAAFTAFCRSRSARTTGKNAGIASVPGLLLFPGRMFAAVYAERYTAQVLTRLDPLPGASAAYLGQPAVKQLKTLLPNRHLILSLLFPAISDLYSTTSPVYAMLPDTVQTLITELEKLQQPDAVFTDTLPFLKSYQKELSVSDIPVFLDLSLTLSRLTAWLPDTPLFRDLSLTMDSVDITPGKFQVRTSLACFTYLFVLLSYVSALLDEDSITNISLYRDGIDACLHFHAETNVLPAGFSCRNEFLSLFCHLPEYRSFLSLAQYLLHRSGIAFTCTAHAQDSRPSLDFTLRLDTRFREEIEFRVDDTQETLSSILPEALDLLSCLTAPPEGDKAAE